MIGYIYRITIINKNSSLYGYNYIGLHLSNSPDRNYYGSGRKIRDYRKRYGTEGLHKEILDWGQTLEELQDLEVYYISMEYGLFFNMNIQRGGRLGNTGITYRKGFTLSEEHKRKLSEAKKGKSPNITDELRKEMSIRMTGENNHMYGINVRDMMTEEDYKQMLINRGKSLKGVMAMEKNPNFNHSVCNDDILSLYNEGKTINEISELLKCSYHLVYTRLLTLGKSTKRKIIDKNLVKKLHLEGRSRKEIGEIIGCSPSRVGQIVKELKI